MELYRKYFPKTMKWTYIVDKKLIRIRFPSICNKRGKSSSAILEVKNEALPYIKL